MDVAELKADMDGQFESVGNRFEQMGRQFEERFEQMGRRFEERFEQMGRRFEERFEQMGRRFEERFEQVDKRFEEVDRRFEAIDRRFEAVDRRFEDVDRQFVELRLFITSEGEKTRLHFDVALEHMKSERNLALDQSMAVAERLDRAMASNAADHAAFETQVRDHERRITRLEE